MTIDVINQNPYLRTSRNFPLDLGELSVEINKSYIDIANAVNNRTISLFPTTRAAITGESWFLVNNRRQQSMRQVYTFTSTAAIAHGLNFVQFDGFTRLFGQFTDGTNWYGLIAGSNVAIAGQVSFYIGPTNITFLSGAGAPVLTSGRLVLEWLSFV